MRSKGDPRPQRFRPIDQLITMLNLCTGTAEPRLSSPVCPQESLLIGPRREQWPRRGSPGFRKRPKTFESTGAQRGALLEHRGTTATWSA